MVRKIQGQSAIEVWALDFFRDDAARINFVEEIADRSSFSGVVARCLGANAFGAVLLRESLRTGTI